MLMSPPPFYSPNAINRQNIQQQTVPGMQGQSVLRPGLNASIHGLPQLSANAGTQNPMAPNSVPNPMAPNSVVKALGQ